MIGYQVFSLGTSFLWSDVLGGPQMVFHHCAVIILSLLSFYPFAHYYILFFIGMAEASTFILCCVDVFRNLEELQKAFPAVNTCLRVTFALSFFFFRWIMWIPASFFFVSDCVELIRTGKQHSNWTVGIFIPGNIALTILQILWGKIIGKTLLKVIGFGVSKKAATD
jgi:hypothetical protein